MDTLTLYEKGLNIIDSCVHEDQFLTAKEWIKKTESIDTNVTVALNVYYEYRKRKVGEAQLNNVCLVTNKVIPHEI